MESEPLAIPAALRALVDSGHGTAEVVDPETNRVFLVTEMTDAAVQLSDEYIREKLEEGRTDLREGRVSKLNATEEILAEARKRREVRLRGEASA